MSKVIVNIPERLMEQLDLISEVDQVTRSEVIRLALRDWLAKVDLRYYEDMAVYLDAERKASDKTQKGVE